MSESEFEICPDCRGLCGKANSDVTIFHACTRCGGNGMVKRERQTMKMRHVLLVGGANDGKRMDVEDIQRIRIPLPTARQTKCEVLWEDYRLEMLTTGNRDFVFYVSEAMSIEAAIDSLLANYVPKALTSEKGKQ